MTKTNPLVKKGTPKFPTKPENNKENHEQLEHPETKKIPENNVIKVKEGQSLNQAISNFYVPPEKIEKKQVSIYLDEDVIEAFNEFGKANGKGAKSDLVNNFLKQMFNIRQG
jgi:uncharacterized protein (DUF4415 family)